MSTTVSNGSSAPLPPTAAGGAVQAPPYGQPVASPAPSPAAQLVPVAPPATYAPQQQESAGVPMLAPAQQGAAPQKAGGGFAGFVRENQQTLLIAGGAAFLGAMFSQGRVPVLTNRK